jgi:endonuclease/exonuclease/phosphatase family metal-dependent hydrolase
MKIASYNIMSGGFVDYSYDTSIPERLSDIQKVVKEINADVIGLIDTFRWDKTFSEQNLRDLFGYEYILRSNLNDERLTADGGESIGLVLMSTQPWKTYSVVRLYTRDALKATLEVNNKEVTFFLAYLDDLQEDVRLKQAEALLSCISNVESTVVMGDLNTFAPTDLSTVANDIKVFYDNNPGIETKFGPVLTQMQQAKVVSLLEAHDLIDIGRESGPTIPSTLFPAVVSKPFLRVDYCFSGRQINVSDFHVHITDTTQVASDHFPISFVIN